MNLFDQAKAKAKENAEKKATAERQRAETLRQLQEALKPLSAMTLDALQTLDYQPCKDGRFSLLTGQDAWFGGVQYLAILDRVHAPRLHDPHGHADHIVFVSAAVESGYADLSDDVRDVPWESPVVVLRSQVPSYAYNSSNPYFHASGRTKEQVEKALDELAEYLVHYIEP